MTAPTVIPDRMPSRWGGPLTKEDYGALEKSGIPSELVDQALLRRVNEQEGREIVGQKGKRDCAGILFPYYWPGDPHAVEYRIRRDHPDLVQATDGSIRQERKYLGARGAGNRLYIPPGMSLEQLADAKVPIIIVEGEKKALALCGRANHESDRPRFVVAAIPGVWSWRGVVGKTGGKNGERLDVRGAIPDLSRIVWEQRTVFILFDRNVHTNRDVAAARKALAFHLAKVGATVKFVNLPEDCGVNGVDDLLGAWGPQRVLDLIERAVDGGRLDVVPPPQFECRSNGIYRITRHGDQLRQTQLTNFNAVIKASIILDDGVETTREFEIDAELLGRKFNFAVAASQFASLDWAIERIGPAATVYAGQRESARVAIQSSAITATESRIYTHTGWCNVAGRWIYLHAAGAIGPDGAIIGEQVRLPRALSPYELQLPGDSDVAAAVRASLRLPHIGPAEVCFPLLAATIRAVFGDADFGVHLAGETGAYKSELAALFQQHFGAGMDRLHLPAAWSSTANSLEALAFQAKDAILVIDDFAPQGSAADVARYHAAADRVFRAAGNHAGRGRLDSTAKLREAKPPRALILSTGEVVPRGHSVRARLLVLEIQKGAIQSGELSACQANARNGLYVIAMTAFIRWLAPKCEQIRVAFQRRLCDLRLTCLRTHSHARMPDIVANLQAAFEFFLEFAVDCGALGSTERDRFALESQEAFTAAAAAQTQYQNVAEPTAMFLTLLRSALSCGRAHLQMRSGSIPEHPELCGWRRNGGTYVPMGQCIGWEDRDDIYIECASAYREVQIAARDAGESLPVTEPTLKRRLKEKGLLASTDTKRQTTTIRRSIAGGVKDVLHFHRSTVFSTETDNPSGENGAEA